MEDELHDCFLYKQGSFLDISNLIFWSVLELLIFAQNLSTVAYKPVAYKKNNRVFIYFSLPVVCTGGNNPAKILLAYKYLWLINLVFNFGLKWAFVSLKLCQPNNGNKIAYKSSTNASDVLKRLRKMARIKLKFYSSLEFTVCTYLCLLLGKRCCCSTIVTCKN